MSSPTPDGGPAFPRPGTDCGPDQDGMSLRDWFAGQALTGIKANDELCHICSDVPSMTQAEAVARMAYADADAMLAAREDKPHDI